MFAERWREPAAAEERRMPHPRGLGDRPPRLRQWAEGLQILASLVVMGAAIYAAIWAANVFAEISRGLKQDRLSHEHKPRQHMLYVYASLSRLDF